MTVARPACASSVPAPPITTMRPWPEYCTWSHVPVLPKPRAQRGRLILLRPGGARVGGRLLRRRPSRGRVLLDQLVPVTLPFLFGGLFAKLGEPFEQIGDLARLSRLAQGLDQAIERGLVLGVPLQRRPPAWREPLDG